MTSRLQFSRRRSRALSATASHVQYCNPGGGTRLDCATSHAAMPPHHSYACSHPITLHGGVTLRAEMSSGWYLPHLPHLPHLAHIARPSRIAPRMIPQLAFRLALRLPLKLSLQPFSSLCIKKDAFVALHFVGIHSHETNGMMRLPIDPGSIREKAPRFSAEPIF